MADTESINPTLCRQATTRQIIPFPEPARGPGKVKKRSGGGLGQVIPFRSRSRFSVPVRQAIRLARLAGGGRKVLYPLLKIVGTLDPTGADHTELAVSDFGQWAIDHPAAFLALYQNGSGVN